MPGKKGRVNDTILKSNCFFPFPLPQLFSSHYIIIPPPLPSLLNVQFVQHSLECFEGSLHSSFSEGSKSAVLEFVILLLRLLCERNLFPVM